MRRGFTILEVMIVVLTIVLIMSVVLPIAVSEIGRSAVEEGKRHVEAGVMLARADAQRRGVVLRLWAEGGEEAGTGLCELYVQDVYREDDERNTDIAGVSEELSGAGGEQAAKRSRRHILMMPRDVRVVRELPERFRVEADGSGTGEADDELGAATGEAGARGATLIVTCLPDGTVLSSAASGMGGGCYVVGLAGRAWSLRFNTWTGAASATEVLPESIVRHNEGGEDGLGAVPGDTNVPRGSRPSEEEKSEGTR